MFCNSSGVLLHKSSRWLISDLKSRCKGSIRWRATGSGVMTLPCLDKEKEWHRMAMAVTAAAAGALWMDSKHCRSEGEESEEEEKQLPVYKMKEVAYNNGQDGRPIWMTYAGVVYDVSSFIPNHPGGTEYILKARGSSIEPYWNLYRQHFNSDLPMKILEPLAVGQLDLNDQERVDVMMERQYEEDDPYKNEPIRHSVLKFHSEQPCNAEVPEELITQSYLTPADLFYIRNHHPVPVLGEEDVERYRLTVDLSALGRNVVHLSLEDIKSLPAHEIVATLQCTGNRRSHYNSVSRTSGTEWDQGAISTASWTGPKLRDVLLLAGLDEDQAQLLGLEHIRFHSLDGVSCSIHLDKAASPYGDCIIAYKMNGEELTVDHGYPIRIVVPGYVAVRNVKWLSGIQLSETEAVGPWQRGLNYKFLPPGTTDAKHLDLDKMPSFQESSLFSGITHLERSMHEAHSDHPVKPGQVIKVKASGWAWAGGGRNIIRIDITGNEGTSWTTATITKGGDQKFNRAWAWVFWECDDVPAVVRDDHTVEICSKALDNAMNSQPEKCDHTWNIRGLGNNSWFRKIMKVA